jgi:hypothetical protein
VVHVRVRDKHIRDPQYLFRRQRREIAEIEQQRPVFKLEIDVEPRVAERIIHEFGSEYGAHGG